MQLSLHTRPEGVTIHVDETRIDAAIATAFKDRVRSLIANGGPEVVLNLRGVTFMDSSGLGAIIALFKAMPEGRRLVLTGLTPNVERVFKLTRMDTVLTIRPAAESAPRDREQPQA